MGMLGCRTRSAAWSATRTSGGRTAGIGIWAGRVGVESGEHSAYIHCRLPCGRAYVRSASVQAGRVMMASEASCRCASRNEGSPSIRSQQRAHRPSPTARDADGKERALCRAGAVPPDNAHLRRRSGTVAEENTVRGRAGQVEAY